MRSLLPGELFLSAFHDWSLKGSFDDEPLQPVESVDRILHILPDIDQCYRYFAGSSQYYPGPGDNDDLVSTE